MQRNEEIGLFTKPSMIEVVMMVFMAKIVRSGLTVIGILGLLAVLPGLVSAAERLAVKTSKANIRSGPGTQYDILWEVEKYHPLVILSTKGKWCKFRDFEGDKGWIYRSLLGRIRTVITTKDKCNVRTGPGRKNAIVFTAERGIPFKVLGKKGNWLRVQHSDGDKGWIYKKLVW